jgi:poly(A) polymerase
VQPRILPRPEHPVSRTQIDKNALKVLYRLNSAGYRAFLVGGSVRDLMLGRRPKDFDVGTDARPPELRRVFKNARIIGRRFRLAHILFPEGVVEVSTFRRSAPILDAEAGTSPDLLITSDNLFGTPEQDAFRRDFTVNALFYDVADFSIVDYTGGIEDLQAGLIRCIGDPDIRFQEDPVRMLRACEFAARLSFAIEPRTQEAIERQRQELRKASPARMIEELAQLLRCGNAGAAFQWMLDLGLLEVILPEARAMVAAGQKGLGEFARILPVLDQMVAAGRELSEIGVLAALLLPSVLLHRHEVEVLHRRPIARAALAVLVHEVVAPFFTRFLLSNLKAQQVNQAIVDFNRMCEPKWTPGERIRFALRPAFPDALLLFELLTLATDDGHEALALWQAAAARRPRRATAEPATATRPRRRKRRRRPAASTGAGAGA